MRYFTLIFLLCCVGRQGFAQEQENFSAFRTKYTFERERYTGANTGEPKRVELPFDTAAQHYDFTKNLELALDYIPPAVKPEKEIEKRKFEGWRIQIYRGRNREEAMKAKRKSYELFPNLTAYLEYSAPTYRVRVGDFLEQSEYLPYLKRFKRLYPTTISVPAIITIIIDNRDDFHPDDKK